MELVAKARTAGKKSDAKKIRREGQIPAILYSKGEKGKEISIDGISFKKILDTIERGTLSSKKITLEMDGKKTQTLVKDIQYTITSYDVIHVDFEELHADLPVTLKIPVRCINAVDCVGIKLGGVLRQVIRFVRVRCLPKDIPSSFDLDVRDLKMGQTLKLDTLPVPAGVSIRTELKEVAVVIAKK